MTHEYEKKFITSLEEVHNEFRIQIFTKILIRTIWAQVKRKSLKPFGHVILFEIFAPALLSPLKMWGGSGQRWEVQRYRLHPIDP